MADGGKIPYYEQVVDFVSRIGVPTAICFFLLYEAHQFLQKSISNQDLILLMLNEVKKSCVGAVGP